MNSTTVPANVFPERFLAISVVVYFICYSYEGALRYGLNMLGLDAIIFLRDGLIALAAAALFIQRWLRQENNNLFYIFFVIVGVHGLVAYVNLGTIVPVVYGTKLLLPVLVGALAAPLFLKPPRWFVVIIAVLWVTTVFAAVLDKFVLDFPWLGMKIQLGGIEVDVSRDWQSSEAERVAGLTRSSIQLAIILPLLSFLLHFQMRHVLPQLLLGIATLAVLIWTTQKGAILGYAWAIMLLLLFRTHALLMLKFSLLVALALMIGLPLILPGYIMPSAQGVFSIESFISRAEQMWPEAWQWIDQNHTVLGVGLGGIGGAQRFYAPESFNAADNLFIFMYANFGVATLLYLGWATYRALSLPMTPSGSSNEATYVCAILLYVFAYGLVISLIEDQLGAFFVGVAIGILLSVKLSGDAWDGLTPVPPEEHPTPQRWY